MSSVAEIDHQDLSELLQGAGLAPEAAEFHGTVCGILAAAAESKLVRWFEQASADVGEPGVRERLIEGFASIGRSTLEQIDQEDFRLELLLPADDQPLAVRALAVRDWCRGFLYGFGLSGRQSLAGLSAEVGEALHDFAEIARLDAGEFGGGESDEQAIVELQEYMRIATLLIRTELAGPNRDRRSGSEVADDAE